MDFPWFLNEIQILQDSLELQDGACDNISNLISCPVHCAQQARDTLATLLLVACTCQACSFLPRAFLLLSGTLLSWTSDCLAFLYDLETFQI